MTPERLADAIGRVFDREDRRMREQGYASLGPQVVLFDVFAKRVEGTDRGGANRLERERSDALAAAIIEEYDRPFGGKLGETDA